MKFPKAPWMECKATNRTSLIDYLKRSEEAKEALRKQLEQRKKEPHRRFSRIREQLFIDELLEEWL